MICTDISYELMSVRSLFCYFQCSLTINSFFLNKTYICKYCTQTGYYWTQPYYKQAYILVRTVHPCLLYCTCTRTLRHCSTDLYCNTCTLLRSNCSTVLRNVQYYSVHYTVKSEIELLFCTKKFKTHVINYADDKEHFVDVSFSSFYFNRHVELQQTNICRITPPPQKKTPKIELHIANRLCLSDLNLFLDESVTREQINKLVQISQTGH